MNNEIYKLRKAMKKRRNIAGWWILPAIVLGTFAWLFLIAIIMH